MVRLQLVSAALVWAASLAPASASPASAVSVRTRNLPGTTDEFTFAELRRRLTALAYGKRETVFKNSTSIDKSWNDATLFTKTFTPSENKTIEGLEAEAGIEIKCATCYIKSGVTAQLIVNGELDVGGLITNVTEQIGDEFQNLTSTARDSVVAYVKHIKSEIANGDLHSDDFSFDNFHIDTDFDIDIPAMPEVGLIFTIDHLDLMMIIEASLSASATLTIPLYESQSAVGIAVGEGLKIGIFATVDLILAVDGSIDLRSGFHLKLDDPVGFNLQMFSHNVSDIIFNGAQFEFLPVTVHAANIMLKAVLRVGLHAGFEMNSDFTITGVLGKVAEETINFFRDGDDIDLTLISGVEVGVHAHVAEFLTNVTAGDVLEAEEGCALRIIQEYTLGIGAAAGATVQFNGHTWGPQPTHTIPIFYTTMADVCAIAGPSTPVPTLAPRQTDPNLTPTTISTVLRHTAIGCADPALINCPMSLRTTSVLTATKTLITAVSSGVTPTFPAETADTVASTVAFGKGVKAVAATTGAPVSYVPPPPPPSSSAATTSASIGDKVDDIVDDVTDFLGGQTGGVSNKVIIGVAVGVGLPVLAALIAGLVLCMRRRKYEAVPKTDTAPLDYHGPYQSPMSGAAVSSERDELMVKKTPVVAVGEVHAMRSP